MAKFRYTGASDLTTVGIAGAVFYKGVVNEVPDERLAAQLKNMPDFEEVTAADLPAVTPAIFYAPVQGSPHPDPEVTALLRSRGKAQADKLGDVAGPGDGLGNINRSDQYAANVEALSGQQAGITEESADGGGEEMASPPAPAPAGKSKK